MSATTSSPPPSRPAPPSPDAAATDSPTNTTPPLLNPIDPLPSVDDEIDLSTLRFLSSSLRSLYLPWLFRLVVFTSVAKILRVVWPYLFRFVRYIFGHIWTAVGWLVRVLAWTAMWVGLIATVVWLLAGIGGAIAYAGLRAKPRWRAFARDKPLAAQTAKKVAGYGLLWLVLRKVLWTWAVKAAVVVCAGWEAYALYDRRASASRLSPSVPASASTSSAAPASSTSAHLSTDDARPSTSPEDADDEELERYARQIREEMLRDSLLRQGRKAASGERPERVDADIDGAQATATDDGA
ncbi:hypothetical protein RTBOTA2_005980 [Rhodotorula toruloides]|uniref:Uncharacterized protein n=1 Tax=Rhodotorula toruloides TaxID=5286 RepID=A0A2S9ZYW3_RHOTO|nr:hypothetical protein RTBOTA2_005980 [Rhodotorula toruloides]PRQ70956.1 hypothetical protein AAT19DRAFT_10496 [Rhodotorula toruloides]